MMRNFKHVSTQFRFFFSQSLSNSRALMPSFSALNATTASTQKDKNWTKKSTDVHQNMTVSLPPQKNATYIVKTKSESMDSIKCWSTYCSRLLSLGFPTRARRGSWTTKSRNVYQNPSAKIFTTKFQCTFLKVTPHKRLFISIAGITDMIKVA